LPRHLLSQNDLSRSEIEHIFGTAAELKRAPHATLLQGRSMVMFFEKSSTRTRLSFEIGMTQLGGHAVYLDRESSQLSRGESLRDTAEVVSRYADIMMARVNSHASLEQLAKNASIPVINGLSDREHPTQTMADMFTILEHKGRLEGLTLAYVGDGNNNVTHSLLLACSLLGVNVRVAAPEALAPASEYVELARLNARRHPTEVQVTTDPEEAVREADVIYTDVWVSMGREAERANRLELLQDYQVNANLVRGAKAEYIFMHCLPQHIGDEVTEDVAYSGHSVIFDQAENRLHVQKAIILFLLEESVHG
jgi:ornithine carbamoyltransferase